MSCRKYQVSLFARYSAWRLEYLLLSRLIVSSVLGEFWAELFINQREQALSKCKKEPFGLSNRRFHRIF